MTFSRRAAAEMTKRVERISRKALGEKAGVMTDALTWAGTFHGIGAQLLREYSDQIGLDPAFTIDDREDSADLMNLARHDLGFSKTANRFPTKGTCLSIYSRCVRLLPTMSGAASTMFWSTNTRIRTGCNHLSCWVSSRSHAQVTCQVPSQSRQRSNARRRATVSRRSRAAACG
jgi:hypothetical protein